LLAAGTAFQMLLATQRGHESDLVQFQRWAFDLAHLHPWNALDGPELRMDHLPGYLYFLWAVGEMYEVLHFTQAEYIYLLKMPAVIGNIAGAFVLYLLLDERPERERLAAAGIYLLLPTALLIGPLWGQTDAVGATLLLLTVLLFHRQRLPLAAVAFTVGFFIKPQIAAALPVLIYWGIRYHPPRVWVWSAVGGVLTALVLTLPFFPTDPWMIFSHLQKSVDVFDFNSSFAFNFWSMFGWFRSDSLRYMGIEWRVWGIAMVLTAQAVILFSLRQARGTGSLALGVALSMLSLYVLLTRVHERYMFAAFLPLLAACFLLRSRVLAGAFVALTMLHFATLYRSFFHEFFNPGDPAFLYEPWVIRALEWSPDWWHRPGSFVTVTASLVTVLLFLALVGYSLVRHHAFSFGGAGADAKAADTA
jgi:Gpi18-like mannosyltransferase